MFISIGILMLVCGIAFKVCKIPEIRNETSLKGVLEKISSNRIVRLPINFLAGDKTLWTNKIALKTLDLSESNISIQQLYIVKFICAIVCLLLIFLIGYTNFDYRTRLVIGTSNTNQADYDEEKYRLYKNILAEMEPEVIKNAVESRKYDLIEDKISQVLNTTDPQLVFDNTKWFVASWKQAQNVDIVESYHFGIIILAFMLPELFLIIRWMMRGCVLKKEIVKLEYIFELLAGIECIKTLDIIRQLQKSSKIYSNYFIEFEKIFTYDKKKGFVFLKNKNVKSLVKLAEILEVYCMSDRKIALEILEREVIERDEAMIMTAEETVDMIDLVAFLSIMPLVYELVMLLLNPMLEIVYKAFEFI